MPWLLILPLLLPGLAKIDVRKDVSKNVHLHKPGKKDSEDETTRRGAAAAAAGIFVACGGVSV